MTPEAKALIRQFHDGTARRDWEAWGLEMIALLRAALRELAESPERSVNAAVPSASGQGPAGVPPTGASGAK